MYIFQESKKHSRHSKSGHDDKRPATDAPSRSSKDAITISQPITVDDHFFTKNEHFRVWLRMHRKQKSGGTTLGLVIIVKVVIY